MASVDWRKHNNNTGTGAAMIGHMARHDGREGVAYSNPDVDPNRARENYVLTMPGTAGAGRYEDGTAAVVYNALMAEVAEIDRIQPPQRVRADRVTLCTVVIPAPEGLTPAQELEFFKGAYRLLADLVGGAAHCSPGYVHRDEIHQYADAHGGQHIKESRAHMHAAVLPYTEERGINGRAFLTRERMIGINNAIDGMCRQRFGVRWLTGEYSRSVSMEQLKLASAREASTLAAREQRKAERYTKMAGEAQAVAEHALQKAQKGLDALRRAEAEEIPTRTHTRGIGANKHATVEIPAEEYDRLKDGAAVAESTRLWVEKERQRAREALQEAQERAQAFERSTLGLQMQIAAKTSELDTLRRRWERVPEEVRQEIEHELSRGRSRGRSR